MNLSVTSTELLGECLPSEVKNQLYFNIAVSVAIVLANLIILLTIIMNADLIRSKEYVIMAGLALADGLYGTASLHSAVRRWGIYVACDHLAIISRSDCINNPMALLMVFSLFVQGVMMVVVTADRLVVVCSPKRYAKLTALGYALPMVISGFWFAALIVAVALILSTTDAGTPVRIWCSAVETIGHRYSAAFFAARGFCSFVSVAMYALVLLVFQIRVAPWRVSPAMEELRTRTRRLIFTIGVCCITTLLFDTLPMLLVMLARPLGIDMTGLGFNLLWSLYCLNAIANVFIYGIGQKEMRQGFGAMVRCSIA